MNSNPVAYPTGGGKYFDVGVTFEMREPNTEKSIFRLILIVVSQHLLNGRVKGKVAERQRERRVRVRV